jgi:hypothetical protein
VGNELRASRGGGKGGAQQPATPELFTGTVMPALFRAAGFDANGGRVRVGAAAKVCAGPRCAQVAGLARCGPAAQGGSVLPELAGRGHHGGQDPGDAGCGEKVGRDGGCVVRVAAVRDARVEVKY